MAKAVVIGYGPWGRDERSALRQAAADRGAKVEMCYFEVTPTEQRRRLDQRQDEAPHTTWPMSDEELAEWATTIDIPTPGELDGSEPIDDPPAGFATWAAEALDEWKSSGPQRNVFTELGIRSHGELAQLDLGRPARTVHSSNGARAMAAEKAP